MVGDLLGGKIGGDEESVLGEAGSQAFYKPYDGRGRVTLGIAYRFALAAFTCYCVVVGAYGEPVWMLGSVSVLFNNVRYSKVV